MSSTRQSPPTLIFAVLAAGAASMSVMQSLVAPVLHTIQTELHTTQSAVSWVLIAWLLSAAIATPILGRIGDLAGKRRVLLLALAAVLVGTVVAAVAPTVEILIVARVLQGVGAGIFPLTFGILRDTFPAERVSSALGAMSGVLAVGGGLGVVLAGPIVGTLGWRWLFWTPAIVIAITLALCAIVVPESRVRAGGRIDALSAVLLAAWLVAILLPVTQANTWGWISPATIGLIVLAVALFVAWLAYERRSASPVIDLGMMRIRAVWTTNLVTLLYGAGMFAIYGFLPLFVQVPASTGYGLGSTVSQAGLLMLPMLVGMAVCSPLSGVIAHRIPFKTQLIAAAAMTTTASVLFGVWHDSAPQILVTSALFGVGMGFAYTALTSIIVMNVEPSQTGVATGMNANIRTVGGAVGTAVMSTIVVSHTPAGGLPAESGFTVGFLVLAGFGLIGLLVAIIIPTGSRRSIREPVDESDESLLAVVEA